MTPIGLTLLLAGSLAAAPALPAPAAQSGEGAPPPAPAAPPVAAHEKLAHDLDVYLEALDRAARFEVTRGELVLRIHFYPNAWRYEALLRLRSGLAKKKTPAEVATELRKDGKRRRALSRVAGFRLELLHPNEKGAQADEHIVHIIESSLVDSLRLSLGGKAVAWRPWREPTGLEVTRVRLAHHYTVKHGARVPFESPLKPDRPRLVFRGKEGALWGLIPEWLVARDKGEILLHLDYREYRGPYDDEHTLDLNAPDHSYKPNQSATLTSSLPFFFPGLPPSLEEFLGQCGGDRDDGD